ncbi:MAG: hypothetical protein IJ723_05785 [Ruminococcus sp.]|nr:hypothetical protein [Ruminococcus sp.]
MNTMVAREKVRAGQPYLYRENGLPSEVFEIRMNDEIDHSALSIAAGQAILSTTSGSSG